MHKVEVKLTQEARGGKVPTEVGHISRNISATIKDEDYGGDSVWFYIKVLLSQEVECDGRAIGGPAIGPPCCGCSVTPTLGVREG